jgi:hypothetical protein
VADPTADGSAFFYLDNEQELRLAFEGHVGEVLAAQGVWQEINRRIECDPTGLFDRCEEYPIPVDKVIALAAAGLVIRGPRQPMDHLLASGPSRSQARAPLPQPADLGTGCQEADRGIPGPCPERGSSSDRPRTNGLREARRGPCTSLPLSRYAT